MKLIPFERRQALAILESFAPMSSQNGLVPREGEVDFVGSLSKLHDSSHARAQLGIRIGLWLVAFAPIWLGVAFHTMAGLSVEARWRLLDRMLASKVFLIRELALAMKIGASFSLMSTRSIRARSGYDKHRGEARVEPARVSQVEPTGDARRPRGLPVLRPSQTGAA